MNPTLKAPGSRRSKLKHDELLSSFAFNFNLRRYNTAPGDGSSSSMGMSRLCASALSGYAPKDCSGCADCSGWCSAAYTVGGSVGTSMLGEEGWGETRLQNHARENGIGGLGVAGGVNFTFALGTMVGRSGLTR